jgi:hypothetical protein
VAESDTYITVIQTEEGLNQKFRAAYTHAQAMLLNGESVQLKCGPADEPISIKQRSFLHGAVLPQIATQVYVGEKRERFEASIWKEHFHRLFIPDRWVMRKLPGAKRATPHRERVSSESLGVARYSQFIDRIIDYAVVEHGVVFEFKEGEREAVRVVAKRGAGRPN